jgi:serine/threonine protein kinase
LSGEERAAWLADFRTQRSDLFDLLEKLLEEHHALAEEHFLEFQPLRPTNERSSTGQSVGAYRLISPIGEGGMGSVWLAGRNDGRFERQVAVKFLRFALSSQGLVERFKREGSILAQLAHPHIAELIDAGVTTNEEPYLVLEYVKGKQIDEYCDEHMLGVDARIELFLDVLGAVAHAHANLVVHRDIKPSNVLISVDGQVKLLDFGIAKLLVDEGSEVAAAQLTIESGAGLTPQFAAPEQISGGAITTGTDVYALGVLLFLLLTGQHPAGPGHHSPADLVKTITETDPPKPSDAIALSDIEASAREASKRAATPEKLRRQLRGDLDTIIAKTLKKKASERYVSVAAVGDDLRHYLRHEPIRARPDTVAYRAAKFIRRHRLSVSAAVVALAAIIAVSAIAIYQASISRRRFQEVRKLAHTFVFDLHDEVAKLEGSTKAREMMVQTGLEYLDNLSRNAGSDLELQKEIAAAYVKIGDAEGYPTKPNLGRMADALSSYQKAGDIYRRIAEKNTAYLPDLAEFYLNYAGLVRFTDDRKQARVLAQSAIETFDRLRVHKQLDGDFEIAYTRAWCTLGDLDEDIGRYEQAWKEFSRCGELARIRLSRSGDQQALSLLSQADERMGTAATELALFEQALRALDEDESLLVKLLAAEPQNPAFHRRQALVSHYRSQVYFSDRYPNVGDPARALQGERHYLAAAEAMVRSDPSNTSAKFSRAVATYCVSFCLREFDTNAALKLAQDSVRMFDVIAASGKASYLITSRRVRALERLGEAQLKAGRAKEARNTADLALAAERPIAAKTGVEWDDEHGVLVQILILAGAANAAVGEFALAERKMREAQEEGRQIAQSGELSSVIPLANADQALGAFYSRENRTDQARACYRDLLELWQRFPDANEYVDRQKAHSQRLLASLR